MNSVSPTLSICIPTYNRSRLMSNAVQNLLKQTHEFGREIELVVSDNSSTDQTEEAMHAFLANGRIRYHRNATMTGFARNYLSCVQSLPRGKFVWVLGDDDLLRPGAVRHVLESIHNHPQIDGIFVNNSYEKLNALTGLFDPLPDFPAEVLCGDRNSYLIDRWENIVLLGHSPTVFTYIGSNILRTSAARNVSIRLPADPKGESFAATFPHAIVAAKVLTGKPAFYIGTPYIALGMGAQPWFDVWPTIQLVRVLDLAAMLESAGAQKGVVQHYRQGIFRTSSDVFWRLFVDRATPGRKMFRPGRLVRSYFRDRHFWRMMAKALITGGGRAIAECDPSGAMTRWFDSVIANAKARARARHVAGRFQVQTT